MVFVEKDPVAAGVIQRNIDDLNLPGKRSVYRADVFAFIRSWSRDAPGFDIVFLDPPYRQGLEEQTLDAISRATRLLTNNGIVVVESARSDFPLERIGSMVLERRRFYGDTALSFYRMEEA